MRRVFVETTSFLDEWRAAGLSDEDARKLQDDLLDNPKQGVVITGACGIRKLRVAIPGRGRRGGGRVIYKDYPQYAHLVLFFFYRKNAKVDLSKNEKKAICAALESMELAIKEDATPRKLQ